eukprot:1149495-Pelagomonas_calceolata.AAC.5
MHAVAAAAAAAAAAWAGHSRRSGPIRGMHAATAAAAAAVAAAAVCGCQGCCAPLDGVQCGRSAGEMLHALQSLSAHLRLDKGVGSLHMSILPERAHKQAHVTL